MHVIGLGNFFYPKDCFTFNYTTTKSMRFFYEIIFLKKKKQNMFMELR